MKHIILSIIMIFSGMLLSNGQELKVIQSPDKNKVNIDARNGVSTIVFKSNIKDLEIDNDFGDEKIEASKDMTFYLIEPESEEDVIEYGYPQRTFILKNPKTSEYVLKISEIRPNTVFYYTVVMPNLFPLSLSAEYLFAKSSKYGIRLSCGKQFGGYLSYKWGEYSPSGNNLNNVYSDADLTDAQYLGHIRKSITVGARFGILHKNIRKHNYGLYLLVGGGYGEYGRQWKNPTQIEGNVYFYSDYMKGFDGELVLQTMIFDWMTLSAGVDMLVDKGNISTDYMLGFGFNLNLSNLRKKK